VQNACKAPKLAYRISADSTGSIGETKKVVFTLSDGTPVSGGFIQVIAPDGTMKILNTDSSGAVSIPLKSAGEYTIWLLDESRTLLKEFKINVKSTGPVTGTAKELPTIPLLVFAAPFLLLAVFVFVASSHERLSSISSHLRPVAGVFLLVFIGLTALSFSSNSTISLGSPLSIGVVLLLSGAGAVVGYIVLTYLSNSGESGGYGRRAR